MKKLNATQIKLIALIAMTIDHVGLILLNDFLPFRIIGRISFPLFAYMIAEGCHYTHDRKKYFFRVSFLALLCQTGLFIAQRSLYCSILVSFSIAMLIIYSFQNEHYPLFIFLILMAFVVSVMLPDKLPGDFQIDYGFMGIMLPVIIFLFPRKHKILGTALGISLLALTMRPMQWFGLLALIPLYFYDQKKGKALPFPYFFYFYYPLHLILIEGIHILLS